MDDYARAAQEVEAAHSIEQLEAIAASLGLAGSRNPQAFLLRALIESRRRILTGGTPAPSANRVSEGIDPPHDRTK